MNIDTAAARRTVEHMINGTIAAVPKIVLALVIFLLFYLVARGISALTARAVRRRSQHRNVALVLGRLAQWLVVLVGVFIALIIVVPSINASTFVQLLGIGGVAIGFAFRDILQNFLAGILLLLTEPFEIGDQIIVGDFEGTVENIETRATQIKTYDGRRVVIPNSDLFTQSVTVNTAYETRRLETDFYIVASADATQAKRVILDAIRGVDGVLNDPPPEALAVGFESAGVTLRARWWINPPRRQDAMETRDRVVTAIHDALTVHKIELYNPNA